MPEMPAIHPPTLTPAARSFHWKWGVLLFCLAIIPFLPALNGQFTWDDDQWLVDNAAVHAWNGLSRIWNPFLQSLHFYPITFTLLWAEHKIWALHPLGYHLSNMLTHAGGAVFLWLCLRRLQLKGAWLAALLWAVHPVQAESVAWISEIKNTLSGLFYFAAFWAYLRFERVGDEEERGIPDSPPHRRWGFYSAALFSFVLALLTKSVVCTLPPALVLILWWHRRKWSVRMLLPILPLFIVGLAIAGWSARQESMDLVVGGAGALHFTVAERCIIAGKDFWFYLRTLVVPVPLMPIYPRWTYSTADVLNFIPLSAAIVLIALLGIARKYIGWWPLVGVLFFVGTLAPALGFIDFFTMHYTFVADHYQYLACAGIIVPVVEACVLGAHALAARRNAAAKPAWPALVAGIVCAVMMGTSGFYASLFQTNLKLWNWNVTQNPEAFVAQHNLGAAYIGAGQFDEGLKHINLALREAPNDDSIQRTVGEMELRSGRYPQALEHFMKAVALRPRYGATYLLLGHVYDRMGRRDDALNAYAQAIAISPAFPAAYVDYAMDLRKAGKLREADQAYQSAISFDPGNLIVRYNYGNLLLDAGRLPEAIAQYRFILHYQDNNALVWHNLAVAYYQAHEMDQAMAAKQRADALDAPLAARGSTSASAPTP
jgi:tetratricopeptide (TPR) repeat protein